MVRQASLGMDIVQAISMQEDSARVGALRRLADVLDDDSRPLSRRGQPTALAPACAVPPELEGSYQRVAKLASLRPIHELDIMAYVDRGEPDCAIQALAHLARLPVATAFRLFSLQRADFLLVVCRAQCFAWSTTERLLMQLRGFSPTRDTIMTLCDEYHDMPVAMAQRFGRFLCAHFPQDRSRLS